MEDAEGVVEAVELLHGVSVEQFSEANGRAELVTFHANQNPVPGQKFLPTTFTVIFPSEDDMTLESCEGTLMEAEVEPEVTMTEGEDYFDELTTSSYLPLGSEIVSSIGSCSVIRCRISTEQEWILWFEEFKRNSNTSWIARSSKPNSKYYIFSKDYVCRRSSYRKLDTSKIGCHCGATLAVRITNPVKSKKVREQHSKDGMWGLVRISNKHNHTISTVDALAYLPPSMEVRSKFEEYFAAGMNVSEACKHHLHYLEMISDENIESTLANGALNPKIRTVRWWYEVWRQQNALLTDIKPDAQAMQVEELIKVEAGSKQDPVAKRRPISKPPPDLTAMLSKLAQLDQAFGSSPERFIKMMRRLQNIKSRVQWEVFLAQSQVNGVNGPNRKKKMTTGNQRETKVRPPQQNQKKRPQPVINPALFNNAINIDITSV